MKYYHANQSNTEENGVYLWNQIFCPWYEQHFNWTIYRWKNFGHEDNICNKWENFKWLNWLSYTHCSEFSNKFYKIVSLSKISTIPTASYYWGCCYTNSSLNWSIRVGGTNMDFSTGENNYRHSVGLARINIPDIRCIFNVLFFG